MVKVTLDKVVTEVMAGAKSLLQLNVDIPDAALQMLKQVCWHYASIYFTLGALRVTVVVWSKIVLGEANCFVHMLKVWCHYAPLGKLYLD